MSLLMRYPNIQVHGLCSGVVVCMNSDGTASVTLVIESQCVRLAELAADLRDPAKVIIHISNEDTLCRRSLIDVPYMCVRL